MIRTVNEDCYTPMTHKHTYTQIVMLEKGKQTFVFLLVFHHYYCYY